MYVVYIELVRLGNCLAVGGSRNSVGMNARGDSALVSKS